MNFVFVDFVGCMVVEIVEMSGWCVVDVVFDMVIVDVGVIGILMYIGDE